VFIQRECMFYVSLRCYLLYIVLKLSILIALISMIAVRMSIVEFVV